MDYFEDSPVLAEDGTIYAGTYINNLYAITPEGKKRWAHAGSGETCCRPGVLPLQVDGRKRLHAGVLTFKSEGPMQEGWPMPNHDLGNTRSAQSALAGETKP